MSAERRSLLPEEQSHRLAVELHQQGLFGVHEDPNDFITLKSGRIAPHYLDIRPGISSHVTRYMISNVMVVLSRLHNGLSEQARLSDTYDHIAGTPEAMTSYAVTIADIGRVSLLQPRVLTGKTSGNKAAVLGRYEIDDNVAVYDDVVTDGLSKIETVAKLDELGLAVADYYVLLDREEGGSPQVHSETGLQIVPALRSSSLVRALRAQGLISQTQYDNVATYLDQYGEPQAREAMETAL